MSLMIVPSIFSGISAAFQPDYLKSPMGLSCTSPSHGAVALGLLSVRCAQANERARPRSHTPSLPQSSLIDDFLCLVSSNLPR